MPRLETQPKREKYHMSSGSSGKRVIEPPLQISSDGDGKGLFCEGLFD